MLPGATLDDVLITQELDARPSREIDRDAERRALRELARTLPADPTATLQALLDAAVQLTMGGTAGVSLIETDDDGSRIFRWVALSGRLRHAVGGKTPGDFSPCGTCLERNAPQLYRQPARLYTYLADASIEEGLVVPLATDGHVLGTIWVVHHERGRAFTREDARVMESLADLTALALILQAERRELEEARQRLAAAEKLAALGGLVSGVAHEIRTPLTVISNHLSLLEMAARDSDGRAAAHVAASRDAIDRLERIVEDLRRFTKHEGEGVVGSVDDWVRDAIGVMRAAGGGNRVVTSLGATRRVRMDPVHCQQVVINLVQNALDASEGTTRPVLVATRDAPDGRAIELVVEDGGVGVPPQIKARMWEPLFTTKPHGTGLGLTVVRRIVERYGGFVACDSTYGAGTRFTVRFPAAAKDA